MIRTIAIAGAVAIGLFGRPAFTQSEPTSPVQATPASIAAGQDQYVMRCWSCHGTDSVWKRGLQGLTDGDIYTVISNGLPNTRMVAFSTKGMTATDVWNVVNYLRTLPKRDDRLATVSPRVGL